MRGDGPLPGPRPYRVAIVTLDAHAAGPVARVGRRLAREFPGLEVSVHASAGWAEAPEALEAARHAVAEADIIVCGLLFIDEHIQAIRPDLEARRDACDALVGMVSDPAIVKLTKMGDLDMGQPSSAAVQLLKKLRGSKSPSASSGEKQMKMLRRLPKLLRYVPGKAQDLRAWFLCMQYWLGGSDENFEGLLRHLIGRYGRFETEALAPIDYPEVGLYHPDTGIVAEADQLPVVDGVRATVGLLLMRSYVLARDTAHYDHVIRTFEAQGIRVLPAFAGGLDMRPAIEDYFSEGRIDALVSLSGFSLVGGPAYNDSPAAVSVLEALDVPYIAAHPLEFQTLGQWGASAQGLGPVETTMLIALPEIDGATNPTVFAGRHDVSGCAGCPRGCSGDETREMAACPERVEALVARAGRLAQLRRSRAAERKIGIVLFNFPPNAGASGTAAYLSVFESLHNTLRRLAAEGHACDVPDTVEALREAVLGGNAATYGQDANVAAHVSADRLVAEDPWLAETEAVWGAAPGRSLSDGRGVFVLGAQFGNVFVGLQPPFGFEGDPMRLLFEKGFAPTHAMGAFYRWIRDDFGADVVLHFGMHGALEFLPGRQAGMGAGDWSDRLIGDVPNVYLYASNNPSEASLAKRRSGAVTVTHVTPPVLASGLYKGLQALKDSVSRWRGGDRSADLSALIADQAAAVDMDEADPDRLWLALLETESALIPDGLHVVGDDLSEAQVAAYLGHLPLEARVEAEAALRSSAELDGLMRALSGRYISPVPGGDLIRSPEVLPAGRNIHAFDPFRMPTDYALRDGMAQADLLIATHAEVPRSVALVLWGSDNIKSDGVPIGQALALMGARPRFDHYGRLAGAELIPLEELGRPRIDVVMTLSGIFRDLLPLQTRLLAEAAWLAATAEEPTDQNFVRAHALAYADKMGCDMETAALRVFSNAEGAYGANVNALIDSGAWDDEGELADAYEARKGFAYGRSGKAAPQGALLTAALGDVDLAYQNLESVELGVTTVDHYFDTLGGISRAVKRAKGTEAPVYIGDQTTGAAKVRTLQDQVALETRSRSLNPRWFEGLLKHGAEGVRQIEAQVTNTLGWSATTGAVDPWVYQRLSETFVLDEEMRTRLAELNPKASARMANRLLEAGDRDFWQPDAETLAALQDAAEELEDRLEGITVAAE
ncbi:magnesium-chelatase subunit H [Jannaschia pagri]|uniref:magnesium chelatase n=1 Tax=Jannaschia pagri TaxID=2829797 RepID=A0ABQ4NLC3_9RHOB|nr:MULTISPECIES: cobaltochelatase subunit CobN [unclassified Jannaschia]GIT91380.1 magnesium-chelatase subunit H [Jannaschia sp. AI_61]GIT95214.1 magnesium-chelatase subunit H [Jannaschia sp. AI_62]